MGRPLRRHFASKNSRIQRNDMTLSKDQILEANDLRTEEVAVPEWGGSVRVRTMTGADRDAFEVSMMTILPDGSRRPNISDMRSKLVALTVVDDAGALLFGLDDVPVLARKSAAALDRVYQAAQRINGLGDQAEGAAEKN